FSLRKGEQVSNYISRNRILQHQVKGVLMVRHHSLHNTLEGVSRSKLTIISPLTKMTKTLGQKVLILRMLLQSLRPLSFLLCRGSRAHLPSTILVCPLSEVHSRT